MSAFSTFTPRRKLSFQSPDASDSTYDSSLSGSSDSSRSSEYSFLSTLKDSNGTRNRRQLCAKRMQRSFSVSVIDKENVNTSPTMQINSPLEQMTLASPSCSSSIDSQGYFSDVFELQDTTSDDTLPKDFSSLLSSSLTKEDIPMKRTSLKRANANVEYSKASKRPSLCDTPSTMISPSKKSMKGSALFRCHSMVVPPCENAMFPDSPGEDTAEKIGDHSKPYLLPTIKGAIADLKSVTSDTVAAVVRGDYSDEADFDIIDCRYPYEYEGGHIMGAINIWEKPNLLDKYFSSPFHDSEKRHIIIFHCEFSSHRGPDMSRFMRQTDREKNGMNFPKLYFPELYLLDGGYKSFFSTHFDLCEPKLYKTMIDNNHKDDFRICSKKSKSWAGSRTTQRQQLSLRHRFSDFH